MLTIYIFYLRCLNQKLDKAMAPKNQSNLTRRKTNESASDESRTELAGDTAGDDETGRGRRVRLITDHFDHTDTSPLIGVAVMCLLLALGEAHHNKFR